MARLIMALLLSVFIFGGPAYSSYLSLIEISSDEELEAVRNIVPHAMGTFGGKFIADLDGTQIANLKIKGIKLEIIADDYVPGEYFLISKVHSKIPEPAISIPSVVSTDDVYIAPLTWGDEQILFRGGYMVKQIGERRTPFFYTPPTLPGIFLETYPTDTLANLVSQDSLYNYDIRMVDFRTRFLASDSVIAARNWLISKFLEFGYFDVSYDLFYVTKETYGIYNYPCHNVICVKPGNELPDKYILVGAHYDSYNNDSNPYLYAPGADDNASGVACVLELARVFKNFDNRKSIMFTPFSAEELGGYGSEYIAENLYEDSTRLEIMVNLDMVGYIEDEIPNTEADGSSVTYATVFRQAMERVSYLIPIEGSSSSDHISFINQGFDAVFLQEGDFNWDGWHTNLDIPLRMDFSYMEQIARTLVAGVAVIDQAPDPIPFAVYDIGDGQSLRVQWDDCFEDNSYKILYGISQFSDTIDVPRPYCSYDLQGLSEGQVYQIGLLAIPDIGLPQIAIEIKEAVPLSIPRMPVGLDARPDLGRIVLSWKANTELDISHYKIFRKPIGLPWETISEQWTGTVYEDSNVESHRQYSYRMCAVDMDGYVSDTSQLVSAVPVSLDSGILLVDETQIGPGLPPESEQLIFYGTMLGENEYYITRIDSAGEPLTRSLAGQYDPIFWVDDDGINHVFEYSLDTLQWYFGFDTDFLLAGWKTIYSFTGQRYFYPGDFYYDQLGISYIAQNPLPDFAGPDAVGDWPVLELKPEAPGEARMPDIDVFTAAPGAEVIYTFNSYSSHPFYDGRPVGIAYDTYHGKRILLGFPLYWLTQESAQALITRVMQYFAEESIPLYGDVNNDFAVNILDITYLISYLYQDGPPPPDMNYGDPNGDCNINLLDITFLIGYLYKGGSEPVEGCMSIN